MFSIILTTENAQNLVKRRPLKWPNKVFAGTFKFNSTTLYNILYYILWSTFYPGGKYEDWVMGHGNYIFPREQEKIRKI